MQSFQNNPVSTRKERSAGEGGVHDSFSAEL
jgi:hypothetical protein